MTLGQNEGKFLPIEHVDTIGRVVCLFVCLFVLLVHLSLFFKN